MAQIPETVDASASLATGYTISPSDTFAGSIGVAGDHDWVRIALDGGYGYAFRLSGDGSINSLAASDGSYIRLRDDLGQQLSYDYNSSGLSTLGHNVAVDGTYYLDLSAYRSSATGTYRLSVVQETAGSLSTRAELAAGQTMTGTIDYAGDRDWVRVELTEGNGYVFRMQGDGGVSSLAGTYAYLRDAAGSQISYDYNSGGGVNFGYTPGADGTFYLDLRGYSSNSSTGNYTFTLEEEIGSTLGTNENLTVGQSLTSAVDYGGDHDWVRVELTGGYGYSFRLTGQGNNAVDGTYIRLRDASGSQIDYSYNSSGGSAIGLSVIDDTTLYLDLSAYRSSDIGGYTITSEQEIASNAATRASIGLGQTVTSQIDHNGDSDWFRVSLTAGAQYQVSLDGDGSGASLTRSTLSLLSDAGETLVYRNSYDPSNSLTFTVEEDGIYYVAVTSSNALTSGANYEVGLSLAPVIGTYRDEVFTGSALGEEIRGATGDDTINGLGGDDTLYGGDGQDVLSGGDGSDTLIGGDTEADLRDVIYGGNGHDFIDGGYGNDELRGDAGNDTIEGGFGADTVIGGAGNDVLTGQAWSDAIFGGAGDDFINGGFGFDRLNGGAGADRFYHQGADGHGSDWIQDYSAAEGDLLLYGGGPATASDFLVQRATTPGAGAAGVEEVFITHLPSGELLWALVDGAAQSALRISAGGSTFDLLA